MCTINKIEINNNDGSLLGIKFSVAEEMGKNDIVILIDGFPRGIAASHLEEVDCITLLTALRNTIRYDDIYIITDAAPEIGLLKLISLANLQQLVVDVKRKVQYQADSNHEVRHLIYAWFEQHPAAKNGNLKADDGVTDFDNVLDVHYIQGLDTIDWGVDIKDRYRGKHIHLRSCIKWMIDNKLATWDRGDISDIADYSSQPTETYRKLVGRICKEHGMELNQSGEYITDKAANVHECRMKALKVAKAFLLATYETYQFKKWNVENSSLIDTHRVASLLKSIANNAVYR